MYVDYGNKIIFFHIPKTGGTVVTQLLKIQHGKYYWNRKHYWGKNSEKDLAHLDQYDYLKYTKVKDPKEYKKYAIVRNPITRFISAWKHINKVKNGQNYLKTKNITTIEEFINHLTKFPKEITKNEIVWISPQHFYTHDINYQKNVDEIMIFENLKDSVKNGLNIDIQDKNNKNNNIESETITLTEEHKNKIKKIYKKDYELLEEYFKPF